MQYSYRPGCVTSCVIAWKQFLDKEVGRYGFRLVEVRRELNDLGFSGYTLFVCSFSDVLVPTYLFEPLSSERKREGKRNKKKRSWYVKRTLPSSRIYGVRHKLQGAFFFYLVLCPVQAYRLSIVCFNLLFHCVISPSLDLISYFTFSQPPSSPTTEIWEIRIVQKRLVDLMGLAGYMKY